MSAANLSENYESYGRITNVISWLLLCVMILTVGTRAATKWTLIRRLEGDDILALIAFTFSIGQTVALSEAISNGLGEHFDTLSPSQIKGFQQVCHYKREFHVLQLILAVSLRCRIVVYRCPMVGENICTLASEATYSSRIAQKDYTLRGLWAHLVGSGYNARSGCAMPHTARVAIS